MKSFETSFTTVETFSVYESDYITQVQ